MPHFADTPCTTQGRSGSVAVVVLVAASRIASALNATITMSLLADRAKRIRECRDVPAALPLVDPRGRGFRRTHAGYTMPDDQPGLGGRMSVKRELAAAAILLLAGGCGGGERGFSTLAASQSCLARLADTTPVNGGVAAGASEAVRLRLPSSVVTVLFAEDADAASALATEYGVVRGDRSQIGSVVLAWEAVPDPDDELAVEECIT